MSKKFRCLLLIIILALIFSIQLGTEAQAGFPIIAGKFPPPYPCGSICIDCILKKLGNVIKNDTDLTALLKNPDVYYETTNHGGQSPTAQGTVHLGDLTVSATVDITPKLVDKNGTAEVTLEISDTALDAKIKPALAEAGIPVNSNWTLDYYNIESFTLRLILEQEGTPVHIIEAYCEWNPSTREYDPTLTCDSQAGPACQ